MTNPLATTTDAVLASQIENTKNLITQVLDNGNSLDVATFESDAAFLAVLYREQNRRIRMENRY